MGTLEYCGGPGESAGYVQSATAGKGRTPGSSWTNEEGYCRSSVKTMKRWGRTDPPPLVSIRKRLDGVMGGDEEGSEVPEPLKVGPTAFFKLVGEVIQVGDTIFDDGKPLGIKPIRTVEEIHHASADHRIQCHQRPLMLVSHLRPALLLVGFPEGQYGISIHSTDLHRF